MRMRDCPRKGDSAMTASPVIDSDRFSRGLETVAPLADVDQIPIVDADTHITEPPDLWTSRVSVQKWGDLVPHVRWVEKRVSKVSRTGAGYCWFVGDTDIAPAP